MKIFGFWVHPQDILLSLIVTVCIFMVFLIWRTRVQKIYQFEMIFMKPGVNEHEFFKSENLDFEHDHDSKKYKIKSERIYRVKPGLFTRIKFKLMGINQLFIIAFQAGKTEPIKPGPVKITSRILGEVKDSQALKKALKNEFAIPMDLKKIVIIIGCVLLAVVVFLVATGQLVIG